jgi:hypothetical protein
MMRSSFNYSTVAPIILTWSHALQQSQQEVEIWLPLGLGWQCCSGAEHGLQQVHKQGAT